MSKLYKTKSELFETPLEKRIELLLVEHADAVAKSMRKIKTTNLKIEDFQERNLEIGALVEGEAYCKELNKRYDVIGFMVKGENQYNNVYYTTYGLRSIYVSDDDKNLPIDFDAGESLEPVGQINNGLGDFVEISDVIITDKEVNKCIQENNIDINKYLKEKGVLLEEKKLRDKFNNNLDKEV